MTIKKKILSALVLACAVSAMSLTTFASPANPGVPAENGQGGRAGVSQGAPKTPGVRKGTGRGAGGTAQGLGIGGQMLQDGSCY